MGVIPSDQFRFVSEPCCAGTLRSYRPKHRPVCGTDQPDESELPDRETSDVSSGICCYSTARRKRHRNTNSTLFLHLTLRWRPLRAEIDPRKEGRSMMTYNCPCCARLGEWGFCPCVIGTCRRCLFCVTHCQCPERHTRACGDDSCDGLDDPNGPFGIMLSKG